MRYNDPFVFFTERRMVALTGLRARTLVELASILREVPGSAVFYHTHHMYLAHHFETPSFTNDCALWVGEALREQTLAEKLAAVDLLSFTSIRALRELLIATMEETIRANGGRIRDCPPGDEFHFCRSKSFIMPTRLVARHPAEFFELVPHISNVSLFFHFFESRLRLERPTNDFSQWLSGWGLDELARRIDGLDPYLVSLDELKRQVAAAGKGLEA